MTYLVFGADASRKESRIAELKEQHLSHKDSLSFDYEILYGHKLDPETLRKALLALPVFSAARFVLVRECHKLTEHNRRVIVDFLAAGRQEHLVLVLEADELKAGDPLRKDVTPYAQLVQTETPPKTNVFDVTRAMGLGQKAQALKMLHGLMEDGQHPLQILGGLVWFWSERRRNLPRGSARRCRACWRRWGSFRSGRR